MTTTDSSCSTALAAYHDSDARPSDCKDEQVVWAQLKHRKRLVLIGLGCVLVVGVALGVVALAGASKSVDVDVQSSDGKAAKADPIVAPTNTTVVDVAPPVQPFTSAPVNETSVESSPVDKAPTPEAEPHSTTMPPPTTTNATTSLEGATSGDSTPEPTTTLPTTTTSAPTTTVAKTTAAPTTAPAPAVRSGWFRFQNNCATKYTLYRSHVGMAVVAPGEYKDVDATKEFSRAFYFATEGQGEATLFETDYDPIERRFFFDISVIPTWCGSSWDFCKGPKTSSFNLPMTVDIHGGNRQHYPTCTSASCAEKHCAAAYLVPNDIRTKCCPQEVAMTITVC